MICYNNKNDIIIIIIIIISYIVIQSYICYLQQIIHFPETSWYLIMIALIPEQYEFPKQLTSGYTRSLVGLITYT